MGFYLQYDKIFKAGCPLSAINIWQEHALNTSFTNR